MVQIPANPSGTGKSEPVYNEFGDIVGGNEIVGATDSFFMDVHEVTIGQFKQFIKSSGYKPKKAIDWNKVYEISPTDKHPMIGVNWNDAVAYTKWAGKRLPTEKEWEFAARGGMIDKEYSWGDDVSLAWNYANVEGVNIFDIWDRNTAPVARFKPNGYGLYDMTGNVWEWCLRVDVNLLGLGEGDGVYEVDTGGHLLRGGSWNSNRLRLDDENYPIGFPGHTEYYQFGFRCVLGSN